MFIIVQTSNLKFHVDNVFQTQVMFLYPAYELIFAFQNYMIVYSDGQSVNFEASNFVTTFHFYFKQIDRKAQVELESTRDGRKSCEQQHVFVRQNKPSSTSRQLQGKSFTF